MPTTSVYSILPPILLTSRVFAVVHWPVAFAPGKGLNPKDPKNEGFAELELETSLVDTWKVMINLQKTGKVSPPTLLLSLPISNPYVRGQVKHIGVSNFTIAQIDGIIKATGVVPVANQIEAHPLLPQDDLVAYAKEKNIHITAYSPLGNNRQYFLLTLVSLPH